MLRSLSDLHSPHVRMHTAVVVVAAAAASVPEVYKEGVDPEIAAYQEHQKTAARPSNAEDARTLLKLAK